jgi:hypothetical protein
MQVAEEAVDEADLLSAPEVAADPSVHPILEQGRRRGPQRIHGTGQEELVQVLQGGLRPLDALAEGPLQIDVGSHKSGHGTGGLGQRVEHGEGRAGVLHLEDSDQTLPTPQTMPGTISRQRMDLDSAGLGEHPEEAVQDGQTLGGGRRGLARNVPNHPIPDAWLVDHQALASQRIISAESGHDLLDDDAILGTALPAVSRSRAQVLGPDSFTLVRRHQSGWNETDARHRP